jgi:predicted dehydrogenase
VNPIRIALIGCGAWGWRYIPSALQAGNCEVTHVAATGREVLSPYGVEVVPSSEWRRLIDAPVDGFIVATPPDSHEEIARTLLEAGRPVMLEKPMALDLGAALRIMIAARNANTPLLINHQHLFAPAYEELLPLVAGWRDCAVISSGGSNGPYRRYSALWDYGPHDVAMVLGLHKDGVELTTARADEGYFRFVLGNLRGPSVVRVWNDGTPKTRRFAVSGEGGLIVYDDLDMTGAKLRHNGSPIAVSNEKPLARAMRSFADAVRIGTATDWRMRADLGVEVTRILAMVEQRVTAQAA